MGQLALGKVRVCLQNAQDLKVDIFLDLGLAVAHSGVAHPFFAVARFIAAS